jgi:hypothetical protein
MWRNARWVLLGVAIYFMLKLLVPSAAAVEIDANGNHAKLAPYVDPVFPAKKKPRPVRGGVLRCACVRPLLFASA